MSENKYVVIVRLRPKDGAAERLMAIRPQLEKDFSEHMPGFVSATLLAVQDSDEWRDIVVLSDPAGMEAGFASEAYNEWSTLVDLSGHEICEPVSGSEL